MNKNSYELRMLEAMLFAATEPVDEAALAARLPEACDVAALVAQLVEDYAGRGVNLVRVAGGWAFRTADDLAAHLRLERRVSRKLSRAAVETLAILAYHQPFTSGEVEEIRGVALSRGTLDVLLEADWIRPLGRRRTPGRPTTWGTTSLFLEHFSLNSLADLPGVDELKAAGLLDTRPVTAIFTEGIPANGAGEDVAEDDGDADEDADAEDSIHPARLETG